MGSPDDEARAARAKATALRRAHPHPSPSQALKAARKAELFAYFAAVEAAEAAGEEPPPFPQETHPDGYQEQIDGRWVEWRGGRRVPLVPLDLEAERKAAEEAAQRARELEADKALFDAGIPFTPTEPLGEPPPDPRRKIEFRGQATSFRPRPPSVPDDDDDEDDDE